MLYNMVPTVNNIILFTSKIVKMIDVLLSILTIKNKHTHTAHKGVKGNYEVLDMSITLIVVIVIMGVNICPNSSNCIY